ncbi:MAG: T9SS type A sorting domain-containing protein, partial [Mameliella sp.]|nr:T9SS type A sorting domain-containing protein [Phaeodactylibacter sp.]
VTLNLVINTVSDNTTLINGPSIVANNTAATAYQWLDCDAEMEVIPGALSSEFTPEVSGNYAVQLIENGCADTSDCVQFVVTDVIEHSLKGAMLVTPNPTRGDFSIRFDHFQKGLTIRLFAMTGQLLETWSFDQLDYAPFAIQQEAGMYLLEVQNNKGEQTLLPIIKVR